MRSIADWTQEIHQTNIEKGWWHNEHGELVDRNPLEIQMLIVSEVAEACEEARKGKPALYFNTPTGMVTMNDLAGSMNLSVGDVLQKPEGELSEMADVVIRVMDYCGRKGWDLERAIASKVEFNKTRPARHGGKKY